MITLEEVKKNPQILEFINQTEQAMEALRYTNHGLRHSNVVAERAMQVAKEIGISEREAELAGIAGFTHDMGNFLTRTFHHFFGAQLFSQVFMGKMEPRELAMIMQAISNHDKDEMNFVHNVSALLVLADKSDVHRNRVSKQTMEETKADIHDRVNWATTESALNVDTKAKKIVLALTIDVTFCPIMEYFEIFTERMEFCRKAAQFLGFNFGLEINGTQLL